MTARPPIDDSHRQDDPPESPLRRALRAAVEGGRGREDSHNQGSVSRALAETEDAVNAALAPEREAARRLYDAVMNLDPASRTPEIETALRELVP